MAYREPSAAKCHIKGVLRVMLVTLRITPHIVPPLVIVLRERLHQIISEKHRFVITKDEPLDTGLVTKDDLFRNSRNANRGARAAAEGVGEGGSVNGDDWRREGGFSGSGSGAFEEDESASGVGVVSKAEIFYFLIGLQIDPWVRQKIQKKEIIIEILTVALGLILSISSSFVAMIKISIRDHEIASSLSVGASAESVLSFPMMAQYLSELIAAARCGGD
ncbi:hypothetical protein U1Q18_023690 [Sarracenia purpurea var. burkii]